LDAFNKSFFLKPSIEPLFSTRPALRSKVGAFVANAFHYSQGYWLIVHYTLQLFFAIFFTSSSSCFFRFFTPRMNLPFYIARRLARHEQKTFSRFIVRLAILAVSLSVAVMIIGSAITQGYQRTIRNKFYACWGQVQVIPYTDNPSNLLNPDVVGYSPTLFAQLQQAGQTQHVFPFILQSAIVKHNNSLEGIVLKGYDSTLPKALLAQLSDARITHLQSQADSHFVLLSEKRAKQLNVKPGSKLTLLFLSNNNPSPKARRVFVKGLYHTGLDEFDALFAITSANLLRQTASLDAAAIQGYELYLPESLASAQCANTLNQTILDAPLKAYSLEERFEAVFAWLDLMKTNEQIIWIIMLIIAVVNITTALLILMLERTRMVGLLKALGMPNAALTRLFLYTSLYIAGIGLCIGNVLGIGLCVLQQQTAWLQLDENVYYIREVPIYLNPSTLLAINLITLVLCVCMMLLPTRMLRRITPVKALQFD
jgi:lipoprotein-releasing system permease protein